MKERIIPEEDEEESESSEKAAAPMNLEGNEHRKK